MPIKWQTKKVEIESAELQWDGSEESEAVIRAFVPDEYLKLAVYETFPAQYELQVYNVLEHQWLNVPIGHWVVKGLKGEFYPCEPEAMDKKYFEVDGTSTEVNLMDVISSLKSIGESLSSSDYIKESDMVSMGDYLQELAQKIEKYGVK